MPSIAICDNNYSRGVYSRCDPPSMEYTDGATLATDGSMGEKSPGSRDVYANDYSISKASNLYPRRRALSPYAGPCKRSVSRAILADSATYEEEISRHSGSVVEDTGAVDELPETPPSIRNVNCEPAVTSVSLGVSPEEASSNSLRTGPGRILRRSST